MNRLIIVILLILGIIAGKYLVISGPAKGFIEASDLSKYEEFPVDPVVVNMTENSFAITYFTTEPILTEVYYKEYGSDIVRVKRDDRGENFQGLTHFVTLKNLEPGVDYFIKIKVPENKIIPENEYIVQSTIKSVEGERPDEKTFLGSFISETKNTDTDAIVYLKTDEGQILATHLDSQGDWKFVLSDYLTKDYFSFYNLQPTDPVEILLISATQGAGYIKTLGLSQNQKLKIYVTKEQIPFYRMQLGEPVSPENNDSGQDSASGGESSENEGFFDAIWVWVRHFFGQS